MLGQKNIDWVYRGKKSVVSGCICDRCGILCSGARYPDGYVTKYVDSLIRLNDLDICPSCFQDFEHLGKRKFFKDYKTWVKNLPLRRKAQYGYVYSEIVVSKGVQ